MNEAEQRGRADECGWQEEVSRITNGATRLGLDLRRTNRIGQTC